MLLVLENPKSQLKNGFDKCRKLTKKVKVSLVASGVYRVQGESDKSYQVRCLRDKFGSKLVECDCQANNRRLFCYHVAATVLVHSAIVGMRQKLQMSADKIVDDVCSFCDLPESECGDLVAINDDEVCCEDCFESGFDRLKHLRSDN
jgi:hypothetical protein